MTGTAAPPTTNVPDTDVALDAAGALAIDVTCRRCGYNLRGLSPAGRCPECGQSIADSLIGDALHVADPAWLGRLVRGARLLVWSLALTPAAFAIMLLGGPLVDPALVLMLLLVVSLGYLLGVVPAWLLTTREPHRPPNHDHRRRRWFIRAGSLAAGAAFASVWLPVVWWRLTFALSPVVASVLTFLLPPIVTATWAALTHHLLQFVRRTTATELAGEATTLRNMSVALVGFALAWSAMAAGMLLSLDFAEYNTLCCPIALTGLYALIVCAVSLYVIARVGRLLREQLRLAEAHGGPDYHEPPVPPGKQDDAAWQDVGHGGPTLLKPAAPGDQEAAL